MKFKKNKKAQGVMGLPFSIIVSILLIVFFIVVAFFAISFFLDWQKCTQVGIFQNDLQDVINEAWYSSSSSEFDFEEGVPSGVKYVCFINMTLPPKDADPIETQLHYDITNIGLSNRVNFFMSPQVCPDLGFKIFEHIELPDDNPHCIEVMDNKVVINIKKEFGEPLVHVS